MKNDVIQYERTYQRLRNKIECGSLPVGARLPGRAVLCKEFGISERTIRRALELLEQDGFLEITPRKRPTVISAFAAPDGRAIRNAKRTDAAQVNDLMQTSILLCYPIYLRGLRLCAGEDWHTPEMILCKMAPDRPKQFWQLSGRLWRFFIARNENELLLRAVDSLFFRGKEPPYGSLDERMRYLSNVKTIFQTVKNGGEPGRAEMDAIFSQYQAIAEQAGELQFLQMCSPCPMMAEASGLEQQLSLAQERYSSVCLDLLGLIAMGRYQPGGRLPTHDKLMEYYGVSRDTTVRAIRMLQDWGVVTAAPRRGISVVMDLEKLKGIEFTPESIAGHIRRYLDSLELLSLTVEKVAAHAADNASPKDLQRLRRTLRRELEHPCEHQQIPRTLLDFITEQIQYDALRAIYKVLSRSFSIGRCIPKLASRERNPANLEIYQRCISSADSLAAGDIDRFSQSAAGVFEQVRSLIAAKCKSLGYWDAAMRFYDGTSLWK